VTILLMTCYCRAVAASVAASLVAVSPAIERVGSMEIGDPEER
jgi:hypothetical protein